MHYGLATSHIQSAVEGSQNVLKQAVKAGISKVVLTSTSATALDRGCLSLIHKARTSADDVAQPTRSKHSLEESYVIKVRASHNATDSLW